MNQYPFGIKWTKLQTNLSRKVSVRLLGFLGQTFSSKCNLDSILKYTVFYLEFKYKRWTTLGNSTKTITRMSWELDLRKISKIV